MAQSTLARQRPGSLSWQAAAHLLSAHKFCGQLGKAEEAHKVISGEARDVQASLEVLHHCSHDYTKAASLQQLLQVLPQLPQQLGLQLSQWSAFHLSSASIRDCSHHHAALCLPTLLVHVSSGM